MTATLIVPVVDEGLGNSAYLVHLGDGRALAVDVPRDLRAVRAAAGRRGLKIAFAADTHLHADFLSGRCSWPPAMARRSSRPRPGDGPSVTGGWPTGMRWIWAA